MKIAVILPSLVNQGPVIVAKDIVNNIVDSCEVIDVYYFDDIVDLDFHCECKKISFWERIDFDYYDIIHSHMLRPDLYIWRNRKKIKKAKCLSTVHQDFRQNLSASYNIFVAVIAEKIWLEILKVQDAIVYLTKNMQSQYDLIINSKSKYQVYNGRDIDVNEIEEICTEDKDILVKLKTNYKIIGCLALLTKRKGIDQLIKALVQLPDFFLVVIGSGKEMGSLVRLSKKMKVYDRCLFMGYKKKGFRYLPYFDIFSMPSRSEGQGLSLIEAGILKKTIVCSSIDVFKELYSADEVCFFDIENIDSLKQAILTAWENKDMLSKNIYKKVNETYSIGNMVRSYKNIYNDLIKN